MGRENGIVSRGPTLLDGEKDTRSLAFAHDAHDVIAGRKLLSVHRLVRFTRNRSMPDSVLKRKTGIKLRRGCVTVSLPAQVLSFLGFPTQV